MDGDQLASDYADVNIFKSGLASLRAQLSNQSVNVFQKLLKNDATGEGQSQCEFSLFNGRFGSIF